MKRRRTSILWAIVLGTIFPIYAAAEEVIGLDRIEIQSDGELLEERRESSIAKRIIKGEELSRYGDLNALEILKRTPGVTINEGKGKKGSPGKGYTKVLVDGEEVLATKRGNPLEQIAPEMIERLEVMTNGSAEYTAESMGGIVNIVLKKPSSEGKTTAKLTLGAYSDAPMGSLFAQQEGKKGKMAYLVNTTLADNSIHNTSSTHLSTRSEYNDNHARNQSVGVTTKLIYTPSTKDKYTFDGSLNRGQETRKSFEERYGSSRESILNRNEGEGWMAWSKLAGIHNLSGTEMVEWGVKYHENRSDASSSTQNATVLDEQKDEGTFRMLGGQASYSIAWRDHFIKTGGEIKRLNQHDQATVYSNGSLTSENRQSLTETKGSWYLQDEIAMGDKWVMTPGARFERSLRHAQQTYSVDYVAPSFHLLYKWTPEDNIRASVAKTVKLPRLDELSSTVESTLRQNDLNHPDMSGNPNLKHEEALSYELRYEHFFEDKGIISMGGFYRKINDKIERLTTYNSGTGRYLERPENAGEGRLWNWEVEIKKSLERYARGVGMFANATFQNSSLESEGVKRNIKGTHDYIANIGLDHTVSAYHLTYGAACRYLSGYQDNIDARGVAESQKGYGTVDLYVKKRIDSVYKMGVNLKNITQETITTTSKRYNAGVLSETQVDHDNSRFQFLVTLEGRW